MINASVLVPWTGAAALAGGRLQGFPGPSRSACFVAKLSWTKRRVSIWGGPRGEWRMSSREDGSASCGDRMVPSKQQAGG